MKYLIIFLFAILLGINANAQEQNKSFSNDTISADTTVYTSNKLVKGYTNTIVEFAFTKIDVTDSLSVAKIQGSMDNSTFVNLTDTYASLTNTSTDGTTVLYVTSPKFLYYRGFLACASGDAVAITNARFIIKSE